MNMQKALAMQIQEITQELRSQQKNLLDNLNKFQKTNKNSFDFRHNDDNYVKNGNKLKNFENQVLTYLIFNLNKFIFLASN